MIAEVYLDYLGKDGYRLKSDTDTLSAPFMLVFFALIVFIVSFIILVTTFIDCCDCCACNKNGSLMGLFVLFAIKVMFVLCYVALFSLTLKLIIGLVIINVVFISIALINKKFFYSN